ncbi:MAG: cyclic nucleotide-binding domain-containing protein, partial [Bacilli bacterium]
MKNILKKSILFKDIEISLLDSMLTCLGPIQKNFSKNQTILGFGEKTSHLGIVLSGEVHIIKDDFWGNESILTQLGPGDIFGETYAA